MTDYSSWQHGGVVFPLATSTGNSLLRDADPALYYALDYFSSVLTTHLNTRLVAEATASGAPITAAVKYLSANDPSQFLTQNQIQFPLLSVYRKTETNERLTNTWDHNESEWAVEYVLPPLTAGQSEAILPILHAVGRVLRNRIENMFDPAYQSGVHVWSAAGIERIDLVSATYGKYLATAGNLVFPAWMGTLKVKERDMPLDSAFEAFTGVDVQTDLSSPVDAQVENFVDATVEFTSLTAISGLATFVRSDAGITVAIDGYHVSAWTDQSGLGNSFVGSSGHQPILSPNAFSATKPALRFDGLTTYLQATATTVATDAGRTLVVFARVNAAASRGSLILQTLATDTSAHTLGIEPNTLSTAGGLVGVYAGGSSYDGASGVDQQWRVHTLRISASTNGAAIAGTLTYRVDGINQPLTRRSGTGNWQGMSTSNLIALGGNPASLSTTAASCDIAIAAAFSRALTDSEIAQVERYCRAWATS